MTGPRGADRTRLASATPGSTVRIVAVPAENAGALAQQGIVANAVLTIEKHVGLGGPVVVRSGRARLAVARPVARDIEVEAEPAGTGAKAGAKGGAKAATSKAGSKAASSR